MSSLLKKTLYFLFKVRGVGDKIQTEGDLWTKTKKKVKQLLCTGYVVSCIVYTLLDFHLINKQGLSLVDSR